MLKNLAASEILYKIVDEIDNTFVIQSTCLRTILKLKLIDLANNEDIISHLSSEQACYVGIKLAQFMQSEQSNQPAFSCNIPRHTENSRFILQNENRNRQLQFFDNENQCSHLLDPRGIALNQELLAEFEPAQSFYIGYLSGILSYRKTPQIQNKKTKVFLRLVK